MINCIHDFRQDQQALTKKRQDVTDKEFRDHIIEFTDEGSFKKR